METTDELIKTDVYYKRIIEEQLLLYAKTILFSAGFFSVTYFVMDESDDIIMPFILLVMILLLCIIDYLSKRKRVLLSALVSNDYLIFEYFYLFRIYKAKIPIKTLSVRNYYKMYGKVSLLTLEFKTNNKLLIEIREDEEYGWDNFKKAMLIKKLYPPVPFEDKSHTGKIIKFMGREINVQK